MTKTVSFKTNDKVVTIDFDPANYFGLSASIYELNVTGKDEVFDIVRDDIEENISNFVDALQYQSINDLVEDRVANIMNGYEDYNDSIYSETHDDDLIEVTFAADGQSYDELLELMPDNKYIKELVDLWKKYQLASDVDSSIINQIDELLNQLDSGESEEDLAESLVNDYLK